MYLILRKEVIFVTVCITLLLGGSLPGQVIPTREWMSFYSSNSLLNDQPVSAGSIIFAYDPDGILCGIDTVTVDGHYGFLQVYSDDPTTPDIDEGAESGDSLYFRINGYYARCRDGNIPIWTSRGETVEIDLEGKSNWPPQISEIPDQTTNEGEAFNSILLDEYVSDPDHADQQLIWTFSGNKELSVQIIDRVVTVTCPDENWFGTDTIIFRVSDPEGLYDEKAVLFTVKPVNNAPVIDGFEDQTINEGEQFNEIDLSTKVIDPDHDLYLLTWTYLGNQELLVHIVDNVVSVICPDENWFGSETIIFRVSDPVGLFDQDSIRFTVFAVNDTPVIRDIEGKTILEGEQFETINLNDYVTDPDHRTDELIWTYSVTQIIGLNILNGILSVTLPNEDWFGSEIVNIQVRDPSGAFDSDVVRFTVIAVNDTPVVSDIANQCITEGEDFEPIRLDNYVYDIDDPDDKISWIISGNQNLAISLKNRIATIRVPDPDWTGTETIFFTAIDNGQLSATDSATFTVKNINDGPVIIQKPILRFREDNLLKVDRSYWYEYTDDPDHADSLLAYLIESGKYVHVQADADSFIFWAEENWFGTDTLPFAVSDGELTDSTHLHVHVNAVNDKPTIELPDSILVEEDTTYLINLWDYAKDVDCPDSLLIYQIINNNDSVAWIFTPESGQLKLILNIEDTGSTDFKVTVIDDSGEIAVDSFLVVIKKKVTNVSKNLVGGSTQQFKLEQNFPNPFNPQTIIAYFLPKTTHIAIDIINLRGQLVARLINRRQEAGRHQILFNAGFMASGVYLYRLRTSEFTATKKMIFLR